MIASVAGDLVRTPSPPPPSPFPPTETDDNKDNFAKPPLSPQAALAPVLATLSDKLEWLNDPLDHQTFGV